MKSKPHGGSVAARYAAWAARLEPRDLPANVVRASADTVIDTLGLIVAARRSEYVAALRAAWTAPGPCTVLGLGSTLDATAAAMINGTAAHGEDFDNTYEGCPVHPGAVIVPAVLAAAESRGLGGVDALRGIAVGQETMCRLGLIAGRGIHTAGFHPTAVIGALGAAAASAACAGAPPEVMVNALGIAGSMASGIIEYLADGSWTKRMHAGWAAQSGLMAFAMAEAGFTGPATVLEGEHGFFRAFAPGIDPDFELLSGGLGQTWRAADVAFKPFASGTMTQPFIDCALQLREQGVASRDIVELRCAVGEGTVHRLWEPLDLKRRPPTAYAAKFSTPYCIAVALIRGAAGLAEFTETLISDPEILRLAERIVYEIDPENKYPQNYSGQIRATLRDGRVIVAVQPHLRGGKRERLERPELLGKCAANLAYGSADPALAAAIAAFADALPDAEMPLSLASLAAGL